MPIDIVFDFAAVHIIGEKAADLDLRILDAKTLPYRYVLTMPEYLASRAIDSCSAAMVFSKLCPLTNSRSC